MIFLSFLGKDLEVKRIENLTDVDSVSEGIKSAIASKQFGYESVLAPLVARACIEVLPQDPKSFNVDNVTSSTEIFLLLLFYFF